MKDKWLFNGHCSNGFTLAELLISLAILGVIASFTIPKIIGAQTDERYKAMGKEAASMIAGAYRVYSLRNTVTADTTPGDFTPYMNYLSPTTGTIDLAPSMLTRDCNSGYECVKLHNGGVLLWSGGRFTGTTDKHAIYFYFDPDGIVTDGTTDGPGKSVCFWLYYNGRLTSYANAAAGTIYESGVVEPDPDAEPSWFSW